MTDRLSDASLVRNYDRGIRNLPVKPAAYKSEMVVLDLQGMLERPDIAEVLPSVPPQQLYLALKNQGLEDNVEILPYLSNEQLVRFLDYDIWTDNLKPDLNQAMKWLKPYNDLGPKGIYERFSQLDEEYQVSLTQGLIRVYDEEEVEHLPHDVRDRLFPFPGQEYFYDILSEDEAQIEFISQLIQSCMAGSLEYTLSLLTYAAYEVPNEPAMRLAQFRKARLEEDGFVDKEEALRSFMPINLQPFVEKWHDTSRQVENAALTPADINTEQATFLQKVRLTATNKWNLETALDVHQRFVFLANSVCAACDMTPDDEKGLAEIFESCQGLVSLGLEFLAQKDVAKGVDVLANEHPKILFQIGQTLVQLVRKKLLEEISSRHLFETQSLLELLNGGLFGRLQWKLETEYFSILGLELTERLKGIFNRFPMAGDKVETENNATRIIFNAVHSVSQLDEVARDINTQIQNIQMN